MADRQFDTAVCAFHNGEVLRDAAGFDAFDLYRYRRLYILAFEGRGTVPASPTEAEAMALEDADVDRNFDHALARARSLV